jgi:polysaccharide biosynthesis/export protein
MRKSTLLILLFLSCAQCLPQKKKDARATLTTTEPGLAPRPRDNTYVIGPADVLTVTVWKQPTLSGSLVVRPDGMISMPLLGDVLASGLTPPQLSDHIDIQLRKYFVDPSVSIQLTQINSKKVYLLGEVQKAGPVDMTPGMTLLQALSSAGGPTDYANKGKIYILRDDSGTQRKIRVHYKDAMKGRGDANLALKPGDTIVVP